MTREEVERLIDDTVGDDRIMTPQSLTRVLEALGLVKLDKSPTDLLMDKLENELRKRYFHDNEMISLKQALKDLDLELVPRIRKTIR